MRQPRRNYSAAFKARAALEAILAKMAVAEVATHHEIHATRVTAWKTQPLQKLVGVCGGSAIAANGEVQIRELREKIGQLTMEISFLEEALRKFPGLRAKC